MRKAFVIRTEDVFVWQITHHLRVVLIQSNLVVCFCNLLYFQYNSEEEFMNDFCTMFSNARDFNEEGSQIHNDAIRLEALLKEKKASFTPMGRCRVSSFCI